MNIQLREKGLQSIADVHYHSLLETALFLLSYRTPMSINELMEFSFGWGTTTYYICPRCDVTLEREYQSFCDRCGQHLNWHSCRKAKIIKAPKAK